MPDAKRQFAAGHMKRLVVVVMNMHRRSMAVRRE